MTQLANQLAIATQLILALATYITCNYDDHNQLCSSYVSILKQLTDLLLCMHLSKQNLSHSYMASEKLYTYIAACIYYILM